MKKYIKDVVCLCCKSVLFWTGMFLVFMAVFHGLRLDDDSYAHYAVSVETLRTMDLRGLATDTWNKPLAGILYGISGLAGIIPARLMSVLMVMLAAFCLVDILRKTLAWKDRDAAWFVVACFIFQVSFFPQAFLTMNEQLAAAMLALGLWFSWVKQRLFLAGLCFGLVMWARMEAALLVVGLFAGMLIDRWKDGPVDAVSRVARLSFAAAIPSVGWWLVATIISGTPFWFRTGYVFIREPFWSHMWNVNAITGLPGALSAAQLLLLIAGGFVLIRKSNHHENVISRWRWALVLAVAFQFVFFSITTVYPRSSDYGGWAIAPLNARSYNILAPLFCLISAIGISEIQKTRKWWIAAFGAVLLLVSHYFFQGGFPFLFSPLIRSGYILIGLALLFGFCGLVYFANKRDGGSGYIRLLSGYIIISAPLMVPFFWNPLYFQDIKADVQQQFVDWYRGRYDGHQEPPQILQSVNGKLGFMGTLPAGVDHWLYPAQFSQAIKSSTGSSVLVILEFDADGKLASRYPAEIIETLGLKDYKEVIRFGSSRGQTSLDKMIILLSSRNKPYNLVVFANPEP